MSKVALEDFKKSWDDQITKIEKQALDNAALRMIYLHYHKDETLFKMGLSAKEFTHDVMLNLDMLQSRLAIALETANSRFKLENRGIFAKIFSGIVDKALKK